MKFGTDRVLGKDIPVKGWKPAPIRTLGKSVPVFGWTYPPKPAQLRTNTTGETLSRIRDKALGK